MSAHESSKVSKSNELKLRILSAVVLAALVLWMTWIGGQTFTLLVSVVAIGILFEYSRICRPVLPLMVGFAGYATLFLIIGSWLSGNQATSYWIASIGFISLCIWELILRRSIWGGLGLAYASLPFFAMCELRGSSETGLLLILILFACVWGADIFAFFFGKTIGGPKLAPRISPKKTWSGFIGSLIGAFFLTYAVIKTFGNEITFLFAFLVLGLAIVSQIGDLLESTLKRKFDVKDSGSIIPGHGGILDRIDGLITAAVLLWIVLKLEQLQGNGVGVLSDLFVGAFLVP